METFLGRNVARREGPLQQGLLTRRTAAGRLGEGLCAGEPLVPSHREHAAGEGLCCVQSSWERLLGGACGVLVLPGTSVREQGPGRRRRRKRRLTEAGQWVSRLTSGDQSGDKKGDWEPVYLHGSPAVTGTPEAAPRGGGFPPRPCFPRSQSP